MTEPRRRLYQAAATVLVLTLPLAWLTDASPPPAADDAMTVAIEDLVLMVAAGSTGDARDRLAPLLSGRIPSHESLAWLRHVVAQELEVSAPAGGPGPATSDARAIASLYSPPPVTLPVYAELVASI